MKALVIHGPNLNMLGKREPEIYGASTLDSINSKIIKTASECHIDVSIMQSNSEAEIIERIQRADFDALIINPAAFTHTSIAIRDAISSVNKPAVEVHISNIYKREDFRKISYIAGVSTGQISGFGEESYTLALSAVKAILSKGQDNK